MAWYVRAFSGILSYLALPNFQAKDLTSIISVFVGGQKEAQRSSGTFESPLLSGSKARLARLPTESELPRPSPGAGAGVPQMQQPRAGPRCSAEA